MLTNDPTCLQYKQRREIYVSLPPLNSNNPSENQVLKKCLDSHISGRKYYPKPAIPGDSDIDWDELDNSSDSIEYLVDQENPEAEATGPASSHKGKGKVEEQNTFKRLAEEATEQVLIKKPRTMPSQKAKTLPVPKLKLPTTFFLSAAEETGSSGHL